MKELGFLFSDNNSPGELVCWTARIESLEDGNTAREFSSFRVDMIEKFGFAKKIRIVFYACGHDAFTSALSISQFISPCRFFT